MWSVWLIFCDCGFHSVCLLMNKDRRLMEAFWWKRGELGLVLMGEAILSSVQSLTHLGLFETPWTCSTPGFPVHHQLRELAQTQVIESVMPSNHLILCCPLLLPPSIFPRIRVFSSESVLHIRWPKYWSFSFSISLSNEYSELISFRIHWLDLLSVQGALKSNN